MIITSSLHTRWDRIEVDVANPESTWFKEGLIFTLRLSHGEVMVPLTKDNLLTLMHECETALHHYNEMTGNE